jgi:hypothetical protein
MINLTPTSYKESLRYARRNTLIRNWLSGLLIIIFLAGTTILLGRSYLQAEARQYAKANQQGQETLNSRGINATLDQVESISGNLKLIIQVLSKQILFSELLKQVGSVMPQDSILSGIEISKVAGGIDLEAEAKDYTTATQVQVNLSDPGNKLFDKIDIVSINCEDSSDDGYPCTIQLRALFKTNNQFLFINQKGGSQ